MYFLAMLRYGDCFCLDQSFGSKRDTEIQSVEKLPDTRADEGADPSRKSKLQNESYDGVNTKYHVSKDSDGKEFVNSCSVVGKLMSATLLSACGNTFISCRCPKWK